jgi:hypothetical protein
MDMEEQLLPIVPFGKYKDKSVLELLADEKYVEWLKQQSWFSNQKQIYNIVVHQTIPTTNNSKTPEHNKLQNLFLDKSNQEKLLSKLFIPSGKLNNLIADEDITRCFGINAMPEFINTLDKTTIQFEDKFNWDLVLYYKDIQYFTITSKLETELIDKAEYKKQYDTKEKEKYDDNLLLIDKLIEVSDKLDQEGINNYDKNMKKYLDECEKYENDIKNYLQQKTQNEKDTSNYEIKLKVYQTKRDKFITEQTKQICQELGINYDNFVNWNITNDYSRLDKDTKHTTEEKKQLREIVDDKLKPFINVFNGMNTRPNFVEKLNIPTKPPLPEKNRRGYFEPQDDKIKELLRNVTRMIPSSCSWMIESVDKLNEYKKDYENKYKKDYENNFNKHYKEYRLEYYMDIIKKYCNNDDVDVDVDDINTNQYKIQIQICYYNHAVCCELKPSLSDDYPVVLRKLKTQIELTRNDKTNFEKFGKKYILIIGSFTSIHVSKKQLITIFNQSNIKVIFTDEIFETSKSLAVKYVNTNTTTNAEQVLFENKLIEENKFLTDNLLQTQQKLLQAEEKIKQLQEEIVSLKSQKQSKSIKDYFGKK